MEPTEVKDGEDIALTIEKIDPQAGEIIILNMKKNYAESVVRSFSESLQKILPVGTHIVINNNDMSMKYLSEEQLNNLGYYRRLN